MAKYDIYAGLSGRFGGLEFICRDTFPSWKEALDFAKATAIEKYNDLSDSPELINWATCAKQYMADNGYNSLTAERIADINEIYNEEMNLWIEYEARWAPAD